MILDAIERELATDPTQSFIVQAPAGSGKTELLTQRFLRLLSLVENPEHIVALTFTRKAAAEMKERIIKALKDANNNEPTNKPHELQTRAYANAALENDCKRRWQLTENPSRLQITTIDALCQNLNNAVPICEKQIVNAKTTTNHKYYYYQAATECLNYALETENYQKSIRRLLLHFDNQPDLLVSLFCGMLGQREQWLSILLQASLADKNYFETTLQIIEKNTLRSFTQSLSAFDLESLSNLITRLKQAIDPTQTQFIIKNASLTREQGIEIADLLMTKTGDFRKKFDHNIGLKKGCCNDDVYRSIQAESKDFLNKLRDIPGLAKKLLNIKALPEPYYPDNQWQILQDLFNLLPLLVAHLQLIFTQANVVDFSAITQQAIDALGEEAHPTDLALYLDYSIHHLLVDEFQDTSISQFQLLKKLVWEWQPSDKKTLFLVGDPMQSIYRFRQAEVGLFLRAQHFGLAQVKPKTLILQSNFRSSVTIVDWINKQFKTIFPLKENIEQGAIPHQHATAVLLDTCNTEIAAWQCANKNHEAEEIVSLVTKQLHLYPNDTIAILAKTRTQISEIVTQLRAKNIPFEGVEIEKLAELPHIQDAWSVTKALLYPGCRLHWLAVLRSPYCGLVLEDLHAIANHMPEMSIYSALTDLECIQKLSDDGRMRACFVFSILDDALRNQTYHNLSNWVQETLLKLHQNVILSQKELLDLEQFWQLLDTHTKDGALKHMHLFEEALGNLYSQTTSPAQVKIMTIHKSKGLEFDCVILPGLGSKDRPPSSTLLRWLQLPSDDGQDLLLLSPIKATEQEKCLIYNYISRIDKEKSEYELQRLLYVACTRTKKRLYLFDYNEKIFEQSFKQLLQQGSIDNCSKDLTTPTFRPHDLFAGLSAESIDPADKPRGVGCEVNCQQTQVNFTNIDTEQLPKTWQLACEYYQDTSITHNTNELFMISTDIKLERIIGIITHELLQWIGTYHPKSPDLIAWHLADTRLQQAGITETKPLLQKIKATIMRMLDDPIGQWILKEHSEEKSEYELLATIQGVVATKIIDRTFLCNTETGIQRWIIDFKTGTDFDNNHYKKQVNEYAKILADKHPTHCGLYYLSNNQWITWEYNHAAKTHQELS